MGKPNQTVPLVPLKPIPAVGEPFEHVLVDCVGPLPKTKAGNQFLLTIMCVATWFLEAVPLRKKSQLRLCPGLFSNSFQHLAYPRLSKQIKVVIFSRNYSNGRYIQLGCNIFFPAPTIHNRMGALERWDQPLRPWWGSTVWRQSEIGNWDEGMPFLLFAAREAKQKSLGFSPAELVFGHNVRGPLTALKEQILTDPQPRLNVHEFVSQCWEITISSSREDEAMP